MAYPRHCVHIRSSLSFLHHIVAIKIKWGQICKCINARHYHTLYYSKVIHNLGMPWKSPKCPITGSVVEFPGAKEKNLGWSGAEFCRIRKEVNVLALSCVQLFVISWTVALQALLSMGFSRQEYWSEQPFLSSEDLPNPGIKPRSLTLQADSLPSTEDSGKYNPLQSHKNSRQTSERAASHAFHSFVPWEYALNKGSMKLSWKGKITFCWKESYWKRKGKNTHWLYLLLQQWQGKTSSWHKMSPTGISSNHCWARSIQSSEEKQDPAMERPIHRPKSSTRNCYIHTMDVTGQETGIS